MTRRGAVDRSPHCRPTPSTPRATSASRVGTPDAQLLAARDVFRLPARRDLPEDSLPEWARGVRREMRVADVDWDVLAAHGNEWMRWWDEHVRGKGR